MIEYRYSKHGGQNENIKCVQFDYFFFFNNYAIVCHGQLSDRPDAVLPESLLHHDVSISIHALIISVPFVVLVSIFII